MRVIFLVIILSVISYSQELKLNQEYFQSKDGMFFSQKIKEKGITNSKLNVNLDIEGKAVNIRKNEFSKMPTEVLQNIPNGSPLLEELIYSSYFGKRGKRTHTGVDLRAEKGTPIIATANGIVEYVGYSGAYGKTIIVDHGFGLKTLYAHLSEINVKKNQAVTKEQFLGKTGRTGRATGAHLHYEVHYYTKKMDPKKFIELNALNYSTVLSKDRDMKELLVALLKGKNNKFKI